MTRRPLSIVVPARDEEQRLTALFELLGNGIDDVLARAGFRLLELVVVDDGSRDGTAALVEERAAGDPRLRLIRLQPGGGKGAAVRAGVLAAAAPFVLVMDADLATPLDQIVPLARRLDEGADIAIGSRGLSDSRIVVHQPAYRELAGKTFNVLVRAATGLRFHDTQCGFKLFRLDTTRALFERQRIDGFAYDVELLVDAVAHGLGVAEVPVRWLNDPQTRVKLVRASAQMAGDVLRIAARRKTRRVRAASATHAPDSHMVRGDSATHTRGAEA